MLNNKHKGKLVECAFSPNASMQLQHALLRTVSMQVAAATPQAAGRLLAIFTDWNMKQSFYRACSYL
jgi:hypothetical protein